MVQNYSVSYFNADNHLISCSAAAVDYGMDSRIDTLKFNWPSNQIYSSGYKLSFRPADDASLEQFANTTYTCYRAFVKWTAMPEITIHRGKAAGQKKNNDSNLWWVTGGFGSQLLKESIWIDIFLIIKADWLMISDHPHDRSVVPLCDYYCCNHSNLLNWRDHITTLGQVS